MVRPGAAGTGSDMTGDWHRAHQASLRVTGAPPVTSVPGVANLRDWLLERWRPGRPYWTAATFGGFGISGPPETYCANEADRFERASLWSVSADMSRLLAAAAQQLDEDVTLNTDLFEHDDWQGGFAVFDEPIVGTDAHTGEQAVPVHAILWGHSWYPRLDGDGVRPGLAISSYGSGFLPLGRSDWFWDTPISDREHCDLAVEFGQVSPAGCAGFQASFEEDRRLLAALVTLAGQANLADLQETPLPRPWRRRAERAGKVARPVLVVNLRHHPDSGGGGTVGRDFSHRWIVSGHWRHQPYGPGRAHRRRVWIASHVKGPADKPLVVKDRINRL